MPGQIDRPASLHVNQPCSPLTWPITVVVYCTCVVALESIVRSANGYCFQTLNYGHRLSASGCPATYTTSSDCRRGGPAGHGPTRGVDELSEKFLADIDRLVLSCIITP